MSEDSNDSSSWQTVKRNSKRKEPKSKEAEPPEQDEQKQQKPKPEVWQISVRAALTGTVLASVNLSSESRVLIEEVQNTVNTSGPFKLLHDGKVYTQGQTIKEFGLSSGAIVDLVRLPKPKEFKTLSCFPLFECGYHCHDTCFTRVPGQNLNAFFGTWKRRFHGASYDAYREDFRAAIGQNRRSELDDAPYYEDVVVADLTDETGWGERGTDQRAFQQKLRQATVP